MIQSIERAINLINIITEEKNGIGIRELGRRSGLNPSTVANIIKTLNKRDWLVLDKKNRKYKLGLGLFNLISSENPIEKLQNAALPVLDNLCQKTEMTIAVTTYISDKFLNIVAIKPGEKAILFKDGEVATMYFSAGANSLLAWIDEEQQREHAQNTLLNEHFHIKGLRSIEDFLDEYTLIRKKGYAENIGRSSAWVAGISFPVFSDDGSVCMSITASEYIEDYKKRTKGNLNKLIKLLKDGAREIQNNL